MIGGDNDDAWHSRLMIEPGSVMHVDFPIYLDLDHAELRGSICHSDRSKPEAVRDGLDRTPSYSIHESLLRHFNRKCYVSSRHEAAARRASYAHVIQCADCRYLPS